jgi:hypothetical protein
VQSLASSRFSVAILLSFRAERLPGREMPRPPLGTSVSVNCQLGKLTRDPDPAVGGTPPRASQYFGS